jgi:hypothetical protein
MALGEQLSPVKTLVTFCKWAARNGFDVGEMHGFSTVHDVHVAHSWHFDQENGFGKAADINKNGDDRGAQLTAAVERAQELGLAVIFARDGVTGRAGHHRDHLHVDVGPFSNLGQGGFRPAGGGDKVTAALQRAVHLTDDEIWGRDTDTALMAVRAASNLHGVTFPSGVTTAQKAVGAPQTGEWDAASRAAHDRTVAAIRPALGVGAGTIWNDATETAFLDARDLRSRV